MRFRTETGSLYEVDLEAKTWARLEEPRYEGAKPLRTKEGTFLTCSPIVVGEPVDLICQPYITGYTGRYIQTSRVIEIIA